MRLSEIPDIFNKDVKLVRNVRPNQPCWFDRDDGSRSIWKTQLRDTFNIWRVHQWNPSLEDLEAADWSVYQPT